MLFINKLPINILQQILKTMPIAYYIDMKDIKSIVHGMVEHILHVILYCCYKCNKI